MKSLSIKIFQFISRTFIIIGAMVSIVSICWAFYLAWFVVTASETQGSIVKLKSEYTRNGSVGRPVFSFIDDKGMTHTIINSSGSGFYSFEDGESVKVLYDKEEPNNAMINSFTTLWLGPISVGFIGAIFSAVSWFYLFVLNKYWQKESDLKTL